METARPNLGSRRELPVDHAVTDRLNNASLKRHEPVFGGGHP